MGSLVFFDQLATMGEKERNLVVFDVKGKGEGRCGYLYKLEKEILGD